MIDSVHSLELTAVLLPCPAAPIQTTRELMKNHGISSLQIEVAFIGTEYKYTLL